MSLRMDFVRQAFEKRMLETVTAHFDGDASAFQWLGVNVPMKPDNAKLIVITALKPGRATSQELGGNEALSLRDGVYIVTLSLPKGKAVDDGWKLAADIEQAFRRTSIETDECRVWCDEPYTENRGTEAEQGRYLISTTIPWSAVY